MCGAMVCGVYDDVMCGDVVCGESGNVVFVVM